MSSNLYRTRSKGYMPSIVFKTILVDRSGSMSSFQGKQYDMVEHLLEDSKKQALETKKPTNVKLVSFDDRVNTIIDQDISTYNISRPELMVELTPRSTTRFNDTLIEEINALCEKRDEYLKTLSKKARELNPDVAMVLIAVTDGDDNESRTCVTKTKERMIKFRKNGGRAILMAANMDAELVGGWYGFNPEKAITVDNSNPVAIESCYRAVSNMARNMTQGLDAPFTALERSQSSQPMPDDDSLLLPPPTLVRNITRQYNH